MASSPLVFTMDAASRYVGLTVRQLYRLISAGKLQTLKIGGRTYLKRAELDCFIEASIAPVSSHQGWPRGKARSGAATLEIFQ